MKRNRGSVMTGANAAIAIAIAIAIATILTNYWEIPSAAAVISAAKTSPHPPARCVIGVVSAETPDNAAVKPGDRSPLQALRSSPGGAGSQGHSVESEQTDRSRGPGMGRILVVEDDRDVLDLLRESLGAEGHQVVVARDRSEE